MTEIEYRLTWARTYLKNIGCIEQSARGVWALTDLGSAIDEQTVDARLQDWLTAQRAGRRKTGAVADRSESDVVDDVGKPDADWKQTLIEVLLAMKPDAFERLFVRVLKEEGFVNVKATGRSGDEGIDGTGIYQLSLVSFPVYFQCKRTKNTVTSPVIRDFRGAMAGRAQNGLLVTTASFTSDAEKEATRAGAQPIDLINGERLADLLRKHSLGVRPVDAMIVEPEYFLDV